MLNLGFRNIFASLNQLFILFTICLTRRYTCTFNTMLLINMLTIKAPTLHSTCSKPQPTIFYRDRYSNKSPSFGADHIKHVKGLRPGLGGWVYLYSFRTCIANNTPDYQRIKYGLSNDQ